MIDGVQACADEAAQQLSRFLNMRMHNAITFILCQILHVGCVLTVYINLEASSAIVLRPATNEASLDVVKVT